MNMKLALASVRVCSLAEGHLDPSVVFGNVASLHGARTRLPVPLSSAPCCLVSIGTGGRSCQDENGARFTAAPVLGNG